MGRVGCWSRGCGSGGLWVEGLVGRGLWVRVRGGYEGNRNIGRLCLPRGQHLVDNCSSITSYKLQSQKAVTTSDHK